MDIPHLIWFPGTVSQPQSSYSFFSWLPSTDHWRILCGPKRTVFIANILLSDLRKYWHPTIQEFSPPRLPPLWSPEYTCLRPFFWQFFWNISMTAKAFTSWWCLLLGNINTKKLLSLSYCY
ncbi:hypothetical protein K501DRAFT_284310 [Backusella circina FSU 941]|nr:hypothetical protein K501DRAFT_284310 [Backusella circina FSU 941]